MHWKQPDSCNLKLFINFINKRYNIQIEDYQKLYIWSIEELEKFWDSIWEFCGVIGNKGHEILNPGSSMIDAKFFPLGKLNFTRNLLRQRGDSVAIYSYIEGDLYQTLSWDQLYHAVAKIQKLFLDWGLKQGDVIAAYMINAPETVIAMLATASIGCIWSVCSPDFGAPGCLDRFNQIKPKVLIANTQYTYNGKIYNIKDKVSAIIDGLPSLQHIITVGDCVLDGTTAWNSIENTSHEMTFEEFDFNNPLCVVYSSGTTGLPKPIIHRCGGVLLQHLKEHQLHMDIKAMDNVLYYTTSGWMMWNWLVSVLASNASIVLYDGSPLHPDIDVLWNLIDKLEISFLGVSAKYLDTVDTANFVPKHSLKSLRTIGSTGAPLMPERFEYVYKNIKDNVHIVSLSGGTDILSCFALGCPMLPVNPGELQTAGLAMAVEVFDEEGQIVTEKKGELVCLKPFPSQPLGFCNDHNNHRYHNTYYNKFPGIWRHGDFISRTKNNGFIFYGRSDTVLKRGGVRIGTAEIYRQVHKIKTIEESIVVSQKYEDDLRIILFVKLKNGLKLDDALQNTIKQTIKANTTPRHVPDLIIQVSGVPRTKNGKLAEIAAQRVVNNMPVEIIDSLLNPEVLSEYKI